MHFAFDMTSRKEVSYIFKEGEKTYKVDMELSEVIRKKPESNLWIAELKVNGEARENTLGC